MRYVAITSMDEKYYDHCGRVMLSSYSRHFFRNIPLYVYNEGNFSFKSKNAYAAGWNLGLEYNKFEERWKNENETRPGKVMCNGCHGAGVIYGRHPFGEDPEYEKCHVGGCNNGWKNCPECNNSGNGNNLGQCKACKGTGFDR
jgi:hypothetical protein